MIFRAIFTYPAISRNDNDIIYSFFINERYHKRVSKQSPAKHSAERRDNFLPKFTRSHLSRVEFSSEQKILIMTYPRSTVADDGDALDKTRDKRKSTKWRNWQDNRDVVIGGGTIRELRSINRRFSRFRFKEHEKGVWHALTWEREKEREGKTRNIRISNKCLAQRDDLSSLSLGKSGKGRYREKVPDVPYMREIGRGKGNENIYSVNEIGSEWERLTGVMHRAGARSWRTARSRRVFRVIPSRLSQLANGELVRDREIARQAARGVAPRY